MSTLPRSVNIEEVFRKGIETIVGEQRALEATKVGSLRAGNTGSVLPDGTIMGKCQRLTYLRYKGVNVEEADYQRELMFEGGRGNEDLWVAVLERGWQGPILREEETPIRWQTSNGINVTGRPDIVLAGTLNGETIPVAGIELKLMSSMWTVRDVLNGKPKTPHLLQAAHYSWKLGVPFQLWYTSRADFAIIGWAQKFFPKKGERFSEYCDYNEKGDIKKVGPFKMGFDLAIIDGVLNYRRIGDAEGTKYTPTIITTEGIRKYYELVSTIDATQSFGPVARNLDADGSDASWEFHAYCELGALCCKYTPKDTPDAWVEKVKESLKKEGV